MKTTLTLLITILFINLVSAQYLAIYQRPESSLTEYQKLYVENFVKNTKTYQLKGNVKSVTITPLDRNFDTLTYKGEHLHDIKNYFEIYNFEFLPNKKLQMYEVIYGREYHENTTYIPKIDTTTIIINYYFDSENNKLIKIIESQSDSYGFHGKTTVEQDIDSLGFLKQKIVYNIRHSEKKMYYTKSYEWNKQRNAVKWHCNHYNPDKQEQGKFSFKGENYKKVLHTGLITEKGTGFRIYSTLFDERGNIISIDSYEPDIRSSLPNTYNFSYKYNEDYELIEIIKNGSIVNTIYSNQITTFQYDNYDEHGNWQEMTINTSDKYGRYTKLKYKREILYY